MGGCDAVGREATEEGDNFDGLFRAVDQRVREEMVGEGGWARIDQQGEDEDRDVWKAELGRHESMGERGLALEERKDGRAGLGRW